MSTKVGTFQDYPVKFSGQILLNTAEYAIDLAEKKEYPIHLDTFVVEKVGDLIAYNFQQLVNWLNLNLNLLDEKLLNAEAKMIENNDFHPSIQLDRKNERKKLMNSVLHSIHQKKIIDDN